MATRVDLKSFDANKGLDRGKPKWIEIVWYVFKMIFFLTAIPWPNGIKIKVLKAFGARVGNGVVIKPRVNIHFPWKLYIGDFSWIGEEVFILNFEEITIGANCCISQRAFLCGGNHNFKDPSFGYRNGPIRVEDGAWIGAQTFVAPNVTIGKEAVITAGSIVNDSMPDAKICGGFPCAVIKNRWGN